MDKGGGKSANLAARSPQGEAEEKIALVGGSVLFRQVLKVVDAVASNDCVVLIEGESGTGKELLARRIHSLSSRASSPFIPVNCPAVTDSLFESQFYGHVRGAFTGAATDTLGVVRAAEGGTLLLDEVGEMSIHLQPKLLRLLQENEISPVGSPRPVAVNTRFIASTNRNLAQAVREGQFRGDLYHRLNIVRIEVPPLRNRPEDIEPLVDYYLSHYANQYAMTPRQLSPHLRSCLREYPWPGNVRELCAYIERLYAADLPPTPPALMDWDGDYVSRQVVGGIDPAPGRLGPPDNTPVCCTLAEAEARAICQALKATRYNRSAAARMLQIHRSTLLRKIRHHGLDVGKRF